MKSRFKQFLLTKNIGIIEEILQTPSYDIAQEIKSLPLNDQVTLIGMIPVRKTSKILHHLSPKEQYYILSHLPEDKAKIVLNTQPIDDLVDLFLAIDPNKDIKLMSYLHTEVQQKVKDLMLFKPETAGSLVTSAYISARESWSVQTTIKHIRRSSANIESIAYIYILNEYGILNGIISIRELLLSADEEILSNIMFKDIISVYGESGQQEAIKKLIDYNLAALPVKTADNKMIGIITFDDIMDIMEEEATEDLQKLGGSEPLNQSYFEASIWSIFSKRIPWLLVLFVAEAYTGTVLKYFADEIETVVALAFFVPLLVGTGGNIGTQVVATIIRAVGIGEVKFKDIFRVIKKEFIVGVLLGLSLGIVGMIRAHILGVGTEIAQVVAIAMMFIVIWSSIIASALPLILRKLKLDPAVVSGPFITTFVDGTGLVIYFMIAKILLNL